MRTWNIYYGSREYARVMGDPLLGQVSAATKQEAERVASKQGLGGTGGVWAVHVEAAG